METTETGGVGPTATRHAAHGTTSEGDLAKDVHKEYHDPMDDWSVRDIILSLVPFFVTFAFKDTDLKTATTFAIVYSGFLLIWRTVWLDSKRKHIWPMLDITNIIAFPILRGFVGHWPYHIHKWWPVILPLLYAVVGILTLLWRRPFTAHYARYPKFDRGGTGLWHGDASYRRTADLTTLGWISAWSVMLLLSLIPILTGHWLGYSALNIIFNYVIPFALLAAALVFHQTMGTWYRSTSARDTVASGTTGGYTRGGAAYPSGATGTASGTGVGTGVGTPATYSSTNV